MARKPDYSVGLLDKQTEQRNPNAGAAWTNEDGTIDLRFDLGIVVEARPTLIIRLFPRTEKEQ